jgi:S-formylglutathione hydrolase FrmB
VRRLTGRARWMVVGIAVVLAAGSVLAATDPAGWSARGRLLPIGAPLIQSWHAPAGMPAVGRVSSVDIEGTTSHFLARPATLYLPPAALVPHPPRLPVLLVLPGRPAPPAWTYPPSIRPPDLPDPPQDWFDIGGLAELLDGYATTHQGLAPVVVAADPFGVGSTDPLCADSPAGNAATYLTRDVPDWVRAHAPVRAGSWAVAGYAAGGTCAVQLAMRAPQLFDTFVDLAGADEPTVGSRELTVSRVFGGDAAAYARINPADIVALHRFPELSGFLAAGREDVPYNDETRTMWAVCQRGGIATQFYSTRGGHDWSAWRDGIALSLPWLGLRLRLT